MDTDNCDILQNQINDIHRKINDLVQGHSEANSVIVNDLDKLHECVNTLKIQSTDNNKTSCCDDDAVDKTTTNDILVDDISYIQIQLNNINKKLVSCMQNKESANKQYLQLLSEINDIHSALDANSITKTSKETVCVTNITQLTYTECGVVHEYTIDIDTNIMFVVMVGGGGAGGVGCVNGFYYYGGGGGGAGACVFKKPIRICKGCIVQVSIGEGGCSIKGTDGGNTYIKIIYPNGESCVHIVSGGKNGYPYKNPTEIDVSGGEGGTSDISKCLAGEDGLPGQIALPSYSSANGGNGGNSCFCKGGDGGSNILSIGGAGGKYDVGDLIGKDGEYGSGGGGSAPRILTGKEEKLSGNGGSGLVIIEIGMPEKKSDCCC